MRAFTFSLPTQIVFGPGTEAETGRLIVKQGGSRVLVLKPQTMMNRSGQAVQQAADTHRLFRWKTSTFISQVTSMPSVQQTTFLQQ